MRHRVSVGTHQRQQLLPVSQLNFAEPRRLGLLHRRGWPPLPWTLGRPAYQTQNASACRPMQVSFLSENSQQRGGTFAPHLLRICSVVSALPAVISGLAPAFHTAAAQSWQPCDTEM